MLNIAFRAEVERRIANDEGRRNRMYLDSLGIPTVGIGWDLQRDDTMHALAFCGVTDAVGVISGKTALTDAQVDKLFAYSFEPIETEARGSLASGIYDALSDARRFVVLSMRFQLGMDGWMAFSNTRGLINEAEEAKTSGALDRAHALFMLVGDHLATSDWYSQSASRGVRNVAMMRTGVWVTA